MFVGLSFNEIIRGFTFDQSHREKMHCFEQMGRVLAELMRRHGQVTEVIQLEHQPHEIICSVRNV